MRSRKIILGSFFITIVIGMITLYATSSDCEYLVNNERKKDHSGVLVKKKNENGIPLMQLSGTKKLQTVTLHNEITGAREFLRIGDSIVKKAGVLALKIFRNNTMHIHDLRYDC